MQRSITLKNGLVVNIDEVKYRISVNGDNTNLQCRIITPVGEILVSPEDIQQINEYREKIDIYHGVNPLNGLEFTTIVPRGTGMDELLEETLKQRKEQTGS